MVKLLLYFIPFFVSLSLIVSCQTGSIEAQVSFNLDQEKTLTSGKALNSSTQSVNRYHSILREVSEASFSFSPHKKKLNVHLSQGEQAGLDFLEIETDFLLPLLPYPHQAEIDAFDKANLLLAEFARNGINLSFQQSNSQYGFVKASPNMFNSDGEYLFVDNAIVPNPGVQPLRMSIVNNCLHPGLWEFNASDAVGEMFHAWCELPQAFYFDMIRHNNNISTSVEALQDFFQKDDFSHIALDLDRLRRRGKQLLSTQMRIAADKKLGGYSSQDSRRKVQRKFYEIYKGHLVDSIDSFAELNQEHVFRLHSFVPPGIYDNSQSFNIPYRPIWTSAEVYEVRPLTSYGYPENSYQDQGTIEIVLHSEDQQQLFAGNIPISLLVFSADYSIPAFGAGVLSSSELIERRHLRLREGPLPHYAYMADISGDQTILLNNHQIGYEQIYLRPVQQGEEMFLRFTIVSYERIVDLLEFEIPITGPLKERIKQASKRYHPPVYEIYSDSNVL
ncbi:MAG: hypothetical protein AAF587_08145 [Bacteroidota bacterium]